MDPSNSNNPISQPSIDAANSQPPVAAPSSAVATPPPDVADSSTPSSLPVPAGASLPTVKAGTVFPAKSGTSVDDEHHNMIGRVFSTIFSNKTPEWVQTDNGPVQVQREMKPGELARGILAAAVTGLAAGYAPSNRGKGQGAAFSSGFEAEKQNLQESRDKKQADAQKVWENQRQANDDEIRRAQNAREQVRSVEQSQEHEINQKIALQNYTKGNWEFANEQYLNELKAADDWAMAQKNGDKVIKVGGKPAIFPTLHDADITRAQKENHDLMMDTPDFKTRIVAYPGHQFAIVKEPADVDTPAWLGMKVDKNGDPILDKDGKKIPDNSYTDDEGKPQVPAGMTTPKQLAEHQRQTQNIRLDRQLKESEIKLHNAEAVKAMRDNRKDREADTFTKNFNDAGGDPNATDKNGKIIMLPATRIEMQKRIGADATEEGRIMLGAKADLEKLDPNTQKDEYDRAKYLFDSSTELLNGYQKDLMGLRNGVAAPQSADRPDVPPQAYQNTLQLVLTHPAADRAAVINQLDLSIPQKAKMLKEIQNPALAPTPPSDTALHAPPDPTTVPQNKKIITDGKVYFIIDANAGVPQGYQTTSSGRRPQAPPPPEYVPTTVK